MDDTKYVTVIGGLTMDLSYYVNKWPEVREAVQAKSYTLTPGGKGLNQATAMARMGLTVNLIGAVGDDIFAKQIIQVIKKEEIDEKNVISNNATKTDLIGIIVDPNGEPGFIGIRNASFKLTTKDIEERSSLIKKSKILMVNFEVSHEVALTALKIAKQNGVTTIFNPAPPDNLPEGILKFVDYFILNEWEAKILCDNGQGKSSSELAKKYHEMGADISCVTLGENGCVVATHSGIKPYIAFSVEEVDTTGAGDAFCGALAYSIIHRFDLDKSIQYASAAGALACVKPGARTSIPTIQEVINFLQY